jgi:hypothetical protein
MVDRSLAQMVGALKKYRAVTSHTRLKIIGKIRIAAARPVQMLIKSIALIALRREGGGPVSLPAAFCEGSCDVSFPMVTESLNLRDGQPGAHRGWK